MNKEKLLTIVGIIVLCIALVGGTFAYFSAQTGGTTSRDVSVTSNTTDNLAFSISNDISFTVTQADFVENGNNKSGSTTATAVLTPNNKTGSATADYYMYLNLETNEIDYSSTNTNEDAELILQVFDSNNQLVTLTGLGSQVTSHNGVTGYDITGLTGFIPLLEPQTITASNNQAATDTWTIVITMINLLVNQNDNTDKTITGEIILQKNSEPTGYAVFLSGSQFNSKIDALSDALGPISAFTRSLTIDDQYKNSTYVVSEVTEQTGMEHPIYAWISNGTLYWYSDAATIYTNEDASDMFNDFNYVEDLDFTGINTINTIDMSSMFCHLGYSASSFTINLGDDFDTSNVTNMQFMFSEAGRQVSGDVYIDLGDKFYTNNVINMYEMFNCAGFNGLYLDLGSHFDVSNVEYANGFIHGTLKGLNSDVVFNFESLVDGLILGGSVPAGSNVVLDLSHTDFTNLTLANRLFSFWNAPSGLTIKVKDAANQAFVISNDTVNLNTNNVVIATP